VSPLAEAGEAGDAEAEMGDAAVAAVGVEQATAEVGQCTLTLSNTS